MIASKELSVVLSANTIFATATADDIKQLISFAHQVEYHTNELILAQHDPSVDAFLVLSGRLLAVLHSSDGREVAYDEIRPGQLFGELAALDGKPRSVSVYAAETASLVCIPAPALHEFLAASPNSAMALMQEMSARIRKLTDRNFQMVVYNVEQRVKAFIVRMAVDAGQLRQNGVLFPFLTHAQIATRIGTNREAVSRTLSQLTKEGVVRSQRQKLEIINVDALVAGQLDGG